MCSWRSWWNRLRNGQVKLNGWQGWMGKYSIGLGSKFEVQRQCCATQTAARKMESNFAACSAAANFFKVCTFRFAFYQWCIIFQPCSQTFPTLQYNIQFMWETGYTDFIVVPRRSPGQLLLLVVVCLKICISFVPNHLTAKISITLQYFNQKCTHVTAYETNVTKRLLDFSLAHRE